MPHAVLFETENAAPRMLTRDEANRILVGFRDQVEAPNKAGFGMGPINLARGPLASFRKKADGVAENSHLKTRGREKSDW